MRTRLVPQEISSVPRQGKARKLINSFILANVCDAVVTGIALNMPGFVEKGIVAQDMLANAQGVRLLIFKTAVTAFMIGIYALSTERRGRWSVAIQTGLQIGTVIVWAVVAWNELNVALALSQWV